MQFKQYWDLRYRGYFDAPADALAEQLSGMVNNSVRRHLVSDVEVGAFLSGGIDSSSIAAVVTKVLHRPLKTFCVVFNEALFDEGAKARSVSDHLHTEHYEILCQPKDVIACVPKMAWQADNLLADQAALPLYLVAELAKKQVSVVLSGDGSDEIFAGYPTYVANIYRHYYRAIPKYLRTHVIAPYVNAMAASTKKLGFDYRVKKFIEGAEFSREKAHYWWRTIFTENEKIRILSQEIAALMKDADAFDAYRVHFAQSDFPLFSSRCLYADLKVWLPDNNLARLDAITMAHSLEARVPFLDHEIVEFASRVPFHLKLHISQPKYILSRAMRNLLPQQVCKERKSPWQVPLAGWFKTELRDYITSSLLDSYAIARFFNRDKVKALIDDHLQGKQNNSFKMWGLLMFAYWYDVFKPTDIT
jgi:asparagine synthase (glutamine-hydrolysing)